MMFCFSETVHNRLWLARNPVNGATVAVITRVWKDALSVSGNLQKLLLSDVIMLLKVYSVLEWLISFPRVALSQWKARFCGVYSHSGSALLVWHADVSELKSLQCLCNLIDSVLIDSEEPFSPNPLVLIGEEEPFSWLSFSFLFFLLQLLFLLLLIVELYFSHHNGDFQSSNRFKNGQITKAEINYLCLNNKRTMKL